MDKKTLLQKLLAIKKTVDFLKKDTDGGSGQKFKFTPSSQVLMSVRKEMNDQGILLVPKVTQAIFHHKDTLKSSMHVTEIEMTMTWIDVETGEDLSCPWYGQGCDQHEKGVGKAYTYAEKYFILKFFNIPTDKDDPDFGNRNGAGKRKATPKDDGGKPGGASKKQYGKLYVVGKQNGLDQTTVKDMIRWYRIGDYLLVKEASAMIDDFDKILGQYLDGKAKEDESN